jgi:hypothetical protein
MRSDSYQRVMFWFKRTFSSCQSLQGQSGQSMGSPLRLTFDVIYSIDDDGAIVEVITPNHKRTV